MMGIDGVMRIVGQFKGPWPAQVRSLMCVFCLDHVEVGAPIWGVRLRDAVFDDEYVLLGADSSTLVQQYICSPCKDRSSEAVRLLDGERLAKVEYPRCEALLKSGRRCRTMTFVKYYETFDEDRCPKHKPSVK